MHTFWVQACSLFPTEFSVGCSEQSTAAQPVSVPVIYASLTPCLHEFSLLQGSQQTFKIPLPCKCGNKQFAIHVWNINVQLCTRFASSVPSRTFDCHAIAVCKAEASNSCVDLNVVLLLSCLQGSPFLPNLVLSAQKRGVKLALLSASLSPDSVARWGAHAPSRHFLDDVLQCFDLIIPASEQVGGHNNPLLCS